MNTTNEYIYNNFKEGVSGKPVLLTEQELKSLSKKPNTDYYTSIYKYKKDAVDKVKETGSIAGINDVATNVLIWDFDNKNDPSMAQQEAVTLCHRLVDELSIDPENIKVSFSGQKGIHVSIMMDKYINPEQFKSVTSTLASGLASYDAVVNDAARIIRLDNTKHPKSGLYKIPLDIEELDTLTIEDIKEKAKQPRYTTKSITPVSIPAKYFTTNSKTTLDTKMEIEPRIELDLTRKPKGWQDYVYAILEGHYTSGERHSALMVLAAKCRAMGYDKEHTYYLCKSSLKKQAKRTNTEEFSKDELWDNIINKSIYSDRWEGGSYSPKNNEWLRKFCEKSGIKVNYDTESNVTNISEAFDLFNHYATNIDQLTIKTGIKELDQYLRMTVGMSIGLIAGAGTGKTSIGLQMLNNMSKQDHASIFFSYDMYAPIVYQKLVQKHMGIGQTKLFETFKTDKAFREKVKGIISEEYKNVGFCFKTGQTVNDIIDTIKETEDKLGKKVKFITMDYNELVITDYSDATAASAFVAQKMREIAQTMDLCVFSLFQPNKMAGTPADEIVSYHSAKGSGAISQSVSVMLGASRPGYDPKAPETDKYLTINCLKNRMGPLFSLDFGWEGYKGVIRTMADTERDELKELRTKIAALKADDGWM